MKLWFEIISELLVNIAAGWFALVFIEPQLSPLNVVTALSLIVKLMCGIISLIIAKALRAMISERR